MIIREIELVHFGKFHRKRIVFSQGLNVVYGKNEAGKSTIHAFIRYMLFGMPEKEGGRAGGEYQKYLPWEDRGGYGGKLKMEIDGYVYCIERSFLAEAPFLKLYDETAGVPLEPAAEKLNELLENMTDANFVNTVSIGQLDSSTQPGLAKELEHFIANNTRTKSSVVDVERARQKLKDQRRKLEERICPDAEEEFQKYAGKIRKKKDEYARLQKEQEERGIRGDKLEDRIDEKRRRGEEEFLAYDRERDNLCRQYEAARRNLDAIKKEKENAKHSPILPMFLALAILFCGGMAYLCFKDGLGTEGSRLAALIFCGALAICVIGIIVGSVIASKEHHRRKQRDQILKKREEHLKKSTEELEKCRSSEPEDYEKICAGMEAELEKLAGDEEDAEKAMEQCQKECDALVVRQKEICAEVAENRYIAQEIEAIDLACETLSAVTTRIQETYGSRLCKEAGKRLSVITGKKYELIQLGPDGQLLVGNEDAMCTVDKVSQGTIEQVYLAVRVAAAELLWQKSVMPFIFDDVFSYYDDERLESAMNMLRECGHQVIIFSCDTREDRILDA